MTLGQLFGPSAGAHAALAVSSLAYDDREAGPGTVFFCVRGFTRDGHDFAPAAVQRGAAALVVDHPLDLDVPQVTVSDVRAAMAPAAALLHGDPTARLALVGITGTNGKTTTAFLTRALLEAGGRRTGLLGTVEQIVGGKAQPAVRTTPEAIDLQATFAAMLDAGDEACVMEVSSHALELRRADAIHWQVAVFTNLTQDHLDFHPSMDEYFHAKRGLFEAAPGLRVANVDDPFGRRLAGEFPGTLTVGLESEDADLRARDLRADFSGRRSRSAGSCCACRCRVSGLVPSLAKAATAATPSDAMVSGYCCEVAPIWPAFTASTPGQPPSTETIVTSLSLPAAFNAWYAPAAAGSYCVDEVDRRVLLQQVLHGGPATVLGAVGHVVPDDPWVGLVTDLGVVGHVDPEALQEALVALDVDGDLVAVQVQQGDLGWAASAPSLDFAH